MASFPLPFDEVSGIKIYHIFSSHFYLTQGRMFLDISKIEDLKKIVTPVKTGVQEKYLFKTLGFRLAPG
jgi:hypothetical protein